MGPFAPVASPIVLHRDGPTNVTRQGSWHVHLLRSGQGSVQYTKYSSQRGCPRFEEEDEWESS